MGRQTRDARHAAYHRPHGGRLCRGTRTWPRSSSCSPTCSRSRATTPSACSPTAARRALIRDTAGSIAQLALDGKAKQLQGIGKTIEGKIVEIVDDGEVHALTKHKGIVPPDVVAFTRLPGLGPKTARRIWHDLGVTTLPELRKAAEEQRLRTLSGLGAKIEENVLKALDESDDGAARRGPGAARRRAAGRARGGRDAARSIPRP